MSNRFSNFVPQDYVSTYIPLPVDIMAKTLAAKQGGYDNAIDSVNRIEDEILKVNAIDDHQPIKQKLVNQYKSEVQSLADEIAKTGDTSKARELKRIANRWQNDPLKNELETSYAQWKLDEKDILKLTSEGKYDAQTYNPRLGWRGIDDQGNIIGYRARGVKPIQDYLPVMDKAIEGIKVDSEAWKNYKKVNGKLYVNDYGQLVKQDGSKEELTGDKLKQIASIVAPTFFQSPESQYYIDKKFGRSMPSFNKLPKDLQDQLLDHATNDIIRRGYKQIFSKTESGVDLQNLSDRALDGIEGRNTTSTQSEGMNGYEFTIPEVVSKMKFDKNGNLVALTTGSSRPYTQEERNNIYKEFGTTPNSPGKAAENAAAVIAAGMPIDDKFDMDNNKKAVEFIVNLQKTYPKLNGLKPEEVINAYKKSIEAVKNESIPLETISGKTRETIGKDIASNYAQREFFLIDGKGRTNDGELKTVLKETDYTTEEFTKILEKGVSGYTQAGPIAGAYYVELPDKKDSQGTPRRVAISPDYQMQQIFKTSNEINKARRSLTPTVVSPFTSRPDIKILVHPDIDEKGNVTWQYIKAKVENPDEQDINKLIILPGNAEKTDLDQIRKEEKEILKSKGYLGKK